MEGFAAGIGHGQIDPGEISSESGRTDNGADFRLFGGLRGQPEHSTATNTLPSIKLPRSIQRQRSLCATRPAPRRKPRIIRTADNDHMTSAAIRLACQPMSDQPVILSPSGPPETVIPAEPAEAVEALSKALATAEDQQKQSVAAVAAQWPRFLDAWARLGELAGDAVESYAYNRVAYHRGLDKLRASGWRGNGYVRWEHTTNQGFLRALMGLRTAAARIGEHDEVERIGEFLRQLDPSLEL